MNGKTAPQKAAKPGKVRQPTQYSNLIRYVPSGTFFAGLRLAGKLIRQSLKTDVLSIAKLRLADLEKNERESVETRGSASKGRMTFDDCVAVFKTQTDASSLLKPSAKLYRAEAVNSILRSWPGPDVLDVRRVSPGDCNIWAAKFSNFLKLFGTGKVSALVRSSFHGQDFTRDLQRAVSRRVRESGVAKIR